jgi:hypothetical protein
MSSRIMSEGKQIFVTVRQCLTVSDKLMNDAKEKRTNRGYDKSSLFDAREERRTGTSERLDGGTPDGDCSSRGKETLEGSRTGIGRAEREGFIYFIETQDGEAVKIAAAARWANRPETEPNAE